MSTIGPAMSEKICATRTVAEALERMDAAATELITVYASKGVISGVVLRAEAERVDADSPVGDVTRRLLRYARGSDAA
jgi:hypothetical protein